MPHFVDSWKRLNRAGVHAKAFTADAARLLNKEAYTVAMEERGNGRYVAVARLTNPPKNDLALELGEFFYQLRAALDCLVYQFAVDECAPNPPAYEDKLTFPIYLGDTGAFQDNPLYKGPYPQELKDWLQRIQPYNIGKPKYSDWATVSKRLRTIHDCARKDRHRRLHIVAAVPTAIKWAFRQSAGVTISKVVTLPANFFEDESDFLELYATGTDDPDAYIQLQTDLVIDVSVPEILGLSAKT